MPLTPWAEIKRRKRLTRSKVLHVTPIQRVTFRRRLESLINETCMEHGSNTPDFILAQYLNACLKAFDTAVTAREKWFGPSKS